MVALLAAVMVMLIGLGAAARPWSYVIKDDREQELLFRGGQIAEAIERYQKKNGNAPPPSLEVLVKGRYLRKPYQDPMTEKGQWRLIRQGEAILPVTAPGAPAALPPPGPPPGPASIGGAVGGITGVASTSKDKSLRVFNGRTKYSDWLFIAGQPRIVGRPPKLPAGGAPPGGQPGASPPAPGAPTPIPPVPEPRK